MTGVSSAKYMEDEEMWSVWINALTTTVLERPRILTRRYNDNEVTIQVGDKVLHYWISSGYLSS